MFNQDNIIKKYIYLLNYCDKGRKKAWFSLKINKTIETTFPSNYLVSQVNGLARNTEIQFS